MRIHNRSRRGIALLLSLLLLPLMAILAFTLTTMGVNNLNVTRNREDSTVAAYVADAGAEEALLRLKEDTAYSQTFVRTMGKVPQTATVTIFNNRDGGSAIQASNGANVPPGFAYVLSDCLSNNGSTRRQSAILARLTGEAPSPWNYAAFGYDSITLTGNAETDSFDSSAGTYASTRIGWGDPDAATQGGHVGTNGNANGVVSFSGVNARVAGHIDVGRNAVASSAVDGTAGTNYPSGSGSVAVLTSNVGRPPVVVPTLPNGTFTTSGVLPPDRKYGSITLSGHNSMTLGDGVYVFDSIRLSGQADIVLAPGAKATVYVLNDLDLSGQGVANASGKPKNLTFYGGPSLTSEITVTGNAAAYYRVYAPNAPVKIAGNGDVFGSVVGKTVRNVGNGKIHYDRSLNSPGTPPDATVVYRQRF